MHDILSSIPRHFESGEADPAYLRAIMGVAWAQVAGETVAAITSIADYRNGTVTIATIDESWRKSLETMSFEFLTRLREAAGLEVKRIELVVDPTIERKERSEPKGIVCKPDDDIVRFAAVIDNDKSRKLFIDAASLSLAAQKEDLK